MTAIGIAVPFARNRNRISTLLAGLVASVSLSACGGGAATTENPLTQAPPAGSVPSSVNPPRISANAKGYLHPKAARIAELAAGGFSCHRVGAGTRKPWTRNFVTFSLLLPFSVQFPWQKQDSRANLLAVGTTLR